MLIANGAQNGFERGALKFGPRKAWEFATTGKLKFAGTTTTAFYLDANELASNDTETTVTGIDFRIDGDAKNYLGASFIYVPTSGSPYPKAALGGIGPPAILPGARQGLNAVNSYCRFVPIKRVPGLFVTAYLAFEHNDRINLEAWGGRIQVGKTLDRFPLKPKLTYSFQSFTGDDPRDTVTLRYAHIRANQLLSPLQFGQATRVELENGTSTVISGVADEHVSDDFFIEYNRIINPNTFLNAGFSVSVPGDGIELVAPGNTPIWPGGVLNLVFNY